MQIVMLAPALLLAAYGQAYGQAGGKTEFEVASIKTNTPQPGFHFAADAVSGGPGTAEPGIFRCSKCSLGTLIVKAFNLQPYQFPGRTSLSNDTYEIQARVPPGTTQEEFSVMLQNLLKDRFGLAWHFNEKQMKSYHLVVAKGGPKLKESTGEPLPATADQQHWGQAGGQSESHSHSGAVVFGDSASYRVANRTISDLVRVLSDQTGLPVDDKTGLSGKYDISLRWSGAGGGRAGNHADGAFAGGAGHIGHDGGGSAPFGSPADPSGPTLFDALQEQLGLKLVPAEQATARLFVVDRVAAHPTEN